MPRKRQHCFVIMPFSKTTEEHTKTYWTGHFSSFLKPHIEECGNLEAHRSEPLRGDILRQIITDLVTAPVVVADLTDKNSNVYWELGVRQSFKHCTVTIAEEGTQLPFDIGGKGTLFYYPNDHLKNAKFCKRFKAAIKDCLSHPDRPDSHVLETISGRGTLFEIILRDEAIRRLDAIISECIENLHVLNKVIKRAKNNQKKPTKRRYETMLLRNPAIELLITNRYINADRSFYESAENYLNWIIAINNQLATWNQSADIVEKWLLYSEKNANDIFNKLKDSVGTVREEISKKF